MVFNRSLRLASCKATCKPITELIPFSTHFYPEDGSNILPRNIVIRIVEYTYHNSENLNVNGRHYFRFAFHVCGRDVTQLICK
jgi:hypothetical protein